MNYATVCSGIGAPEVAWRDTWGEPVFTSEIEKFPSAVLKHHMPGVPNRGDMTKYKEWPDHDIELICGGTPCQSFSIAGLRKGMDDPRGNLALVYLGIIDRYWPRWVVWENVPGVLSSSGGRDFSAFVSALAELGYSCAWRVLDAQYFGVPQRRRRVFVVGHLGADWRPPFAVLFEPQSMRGDIKKGGKEGQGAATHFEVGPGGARETSVSPTLDARCKDGCIRNQVGSLVMAHGQGGAEIIKDGSPSLTCNHEAPILFAAAGRSKYSETDIATSLRAAQDKQQDTDLLCFSYKDSRKSEGAISPTLQNQHNGHVAVAFRACGQQGFNPSPIAPPVCATDGGGANTPTALIDTILRRLTPMECERLQGFPDNYTRIPWRGKDADQCPDGPRYKSLGNSMAVPVLKWIGRRIQLWESLNVRPE